MGNPINNPSPITNDKISDIQKGLAICAYHEAGHAVIAVLHKVKIDYVQLGMMAGVVMPYEQPGSNYSLEDAVACILAGDCAVFMHTGIKKTGMLSDDKMILFECFDRLYPGEGWSERKRNHLTRMISEIRTELGEAWPAVKAVAAELLAKRWMRGSECKQIVLNALKRKPI